MPAASLRTRLERLRSGLRHPERVLPLLGAALVLGLLCSLGCSSVRPPRGVKPVTVTMVCTGYCNCQACCGWERSWWRLGMPVYSSGPLEGERKIVGQTASGRMTRYGTAAVDRSRYPFGTVFKVPGYGYARAEDVGGAIKGNAIDLWFPSHEEALEWGRKILKVQVWKVP